MSSLLLAALAAIQPAPAITAEELLAKAKETFGLDLQRESVPCPEGEPGEIIVCHQTEDPAKLRIEHEVDPDMGAPPRPPEMAPPCTGVCMRVGKVPPYPPIIDLRALPEAPAGSDADRLYGWRQDAEPPAAEPAGEEAAEP